MRDIILDAFDRKISYIIPLLETVKNCGYTAIQISPIQPCKQAGQWWELYQVFDFSIGNRIGTEDELRELCTKANNLGIRIICDIVVGHVAESETKSLEPHENVSQQLLENSFFWKERRPIENWEDRYQVVNWCYGLPCLRLDNYDLEDIVIAFLNRLIDLGVRGFRVDSGKSIALPCENNDFFKRVFKDLHHKDELLNYAEVIFYPKEMLDKYAECINVLTNGVTSDRRKLVTFFMTHDTDLKFGYTTKLNNWDIIDQWRKLLESNKVSSMVFYARPPINGVSEEDSKLWMWREIADINWRCR